MKNSTGTFPRMVLLKETKEKGDALFPEAIRLHFQYGKATTDLLQRKLSVGYARAARIIDELEYEKDLVNNLISQSYMISSTLEAHGIWVKLVRIDVLEKEICFYFDVSVGTELKRLVKLNKELSLSLASPTGDIKIEAPVPGTTLVGVCLPTITKNKKERFNAIHAEVNQPKPTEFMSKVRDGLLKLAEAITKLAYKI